MPTTPFEHDTQADEESKKPDEKEDTPVAADGAENAAEQAMPRDWSRSHTAFEQIHADMGEVAGLANAAFEALLEMPRLESPQARREMRTVTALFRATRDASRDSLFRWDRWVEQFEGREIYYGEDELDDGQDELIDP